MYCILADDGYPSAVFANPQPQNPAVIELPDSDPKVAAYRAGNTPAQLVSHATAKQKTLAEGGFSFNVASSGQPAKVVQADTNTRGRVDLAGLVALAQLDPSFTTRWVQSDGALTLGQSEIIALGAAVGRFYSATYAALIAVIGEIEAGTLKTGADVENASAWPANVG